MVTLTEIRRAFHGRRPVRTPFSGDKRRAAVALILAGAEENLHVAMIRRAERAGDPWSGQMALPGGRAEPEDGDAESVAERETLEEVGIALERDQLVGTMDEIPVLLGKVDTGIVLSPFVYALPGEPPAFILNGEVARAYWVPLGHLLGQEHPTELTVERSGRRLRYPAIEYEQETIWGLTYRVLAGFSRLVDRPLPDLPWPLGPA